MSPRRSSRARSSQIPSGTNTHTNSSSSQTSNAKGDRSTRASNGARNRTASPRGTSTVRSDSIDDADSTSRSVHTAESSLPPRRSRRGNETDLQDKEMKTLQDGYDEAEEEAIEEEITRCICGQTEYPGPNATVREHWTSSEPITEDTGNFFVQCDKCHVWQHGGCMGLVDESIIPDEYYCEQCKPEYHDIKKAPNSNKSSWYLPVRQGEMSSNRSTPISTTDVPRKAGAKNKSLESTKRRATMNSRGAYDEDEMLRRAIEESSKEIGSLGKRTRDNAEEPNLAVKRQRTSSNASSANSGRSISPDAENDARALSNFGNSKNAARFRGLVAKNNREKEIRDKQKEQMAAIRAEAASKRNARSERRRAEDSPPPTPTLSPAKAAPGTSLNVKPKAETPPASKVAQQRKGGRPAARRGRLGRNQYSREQAANGDLSDTPMQDAYDRNPDSPRPHLNGNINGESGRSSKAKTHPARTSMNEMKRRVAAILEFVGHMQTERGGGRSKESDSGGSHSSRGSSLKGTSTPNGSRPTPHLPTASLVKAVTEGLEEAHERKALSTDSDKDTITIPSLQIKTEKEFDKMNALEMMETLTKDLVTWQAVYGVYAR